MLNQLEQSLLLKTLEEQRDMIDAMGKLVDAQSALLKGITQTLKDAKNIKENQRFSFLEKRVENLVKYPETTLKYIMKGTQ